MRQIYFLYQCGKIRVSIHALLAECDPLNWGIFFAPMKFQSTHSLRSATKDMLRGRAPYNVSIHALLAECDGAIGLFAIGASGFNPRTPCGVRHSSCENVKEKINVSIHALLAECDNFFEKLFDNTIVSIHALLAECDLRKFFERYNFLSFNPRTPCGVRLARIHFYVALIPFQSTHSLRSATTIDVLRLRFKRFQSTHSLRLSLIHI